VLDKKRERDNINFVFLKEIGALKQQEMPVSKLMSHVYTLS